MRHNPRHIIAAILLSSAMLAGCEKDKVSGAIGEIGSFVLDCSEGASEQKVINAEGDWTVQCSADWFSVTPESGTPGQCMVTVTGNSENTSLRERGGKISFISGNNVTSTYVYQRGKRGIELENDEYNAGGFSGKVTIPVGGNTKFTAESTSGWLSVDEINYGSASELLNDGKTYSDYVNSEIICSIQSNDGKERTCEITVTDDSGQKYTVTVIQGSMPEPSWDKNFFRRTLGIRFTATWCGYCPNMAEAYETACDKYPNRIIPVSCHPTTSEGGLAWEGTKALQDFYAVEAYPTTVLNGYASVRNTTLTSLAYGIEQVAREAKEYYPSQTGIMASASKSSDMVYADVRLAMKSAGQYKICAYILEDNIKFKQQGVGDNYTHNYIVRGSLTDVFGTEVTADSDNSYVDISLSGKLPAIIRDLNNCYLVIFTTRQGKLTSKDVDIAAYYDYGFIVDNVVKCKIGERTDFEYES